MRTLSYGAVVFLPLLSCGAPSTGIQEGSPVPDAVFTASDGTSIRLSSYAQADAGGSDLLMLRVVAGWCGTCRWSAAHTRELVPLGAEARVRWVDVLLTGDENAPASAGDAVIWSARSDGIATTLTDPGFQLRSLFPPRAALPLVAIVDTRSMTALSVLSNATPEQVTGAIANDLATLDGKTAPPAVNAPEIDQRFTRDRWEMIQEMALPGTPPPDASNAYADNAAAAALGKALFSDGVLSPKGISCGTCHWSELLFSDGKETPAEGVHPLDRNAPTTLLAGYRQTQLWDGRADSLWMQAMAPIETASEFGSSRLFAAHAIFEHYQGEYEAIFGDLPELEDTNRFPVNGRPGDPAWEALSEADRDAVTQVYVNIGKSLAAYERSQRPEPSVLDAYARGNLSVLTESEKDGLEAFFDAGCAQCHYGPLLTDNSFHNLRFPTGRRDRAADRGRMDGVEQLLASEFNRAGPYSDDPRSFVEPARGEHTLGAFKTPSLRGVGYTLPYGHGGSYWGLTSVLESLHAGGLPAESAYAVGDTDPFLADFDAALIPDLISFLLALRLDISP